MAELDEKIVKKPAHVVIVEMIRESIGAIKKTPAANEIELSAQMGALLAEFGMLKRMIIPEKHLAEVIASLCQIKEICPEKAKRLLSEFLVLLALGLTPQNPIAEFLAQGGDFSSEEGMKLINDSKSSDVANAAKDPEVMNALISAMDKSSDPYFRRNILAGLSEDNSVGMS